MANDDKITQRYYGLFSESDRDEARARVHWMCKKVEGQKVIDIGCSQGIVSILLARAGYEVLGIDINDKAIEFANSEKEKEPPEVQQNLTFIRGNILNVDLPAKGFHTAIMGEFLEHQVRPEKAIVRAHELLVNEGNLVVTVPFGLHRDPDHKQTFYTGSLYKLIFPYFEVSETHMIGKYLCLLGKKREIVIDEEVNRIPLALAEESEHAFQDREVTLTRYLDAATRGRDAATRERDAVAKDRDTLKEKLEELEILHSQTKEALNNTIAELRDRIITIQGQYTDKLEQLRNSVRYQVGDALINAIRHPWNMVGLPLRLWHIFRQYRTKTGKAKRPVPSVATASHVVANISGQESHIQQVRLLFMPTNGAGLGHVSRLFAIARRLKDHPRIEEIVFVTTSDGLTLFRREGFIAYHFPPADRLRGSLTPGEWDASLGRFLEMILTNHKINAFVFDGVHAFPGVMHAINKIGKVRTAWIRQGLLKQGFQDRNDENRFFDLQIVPGEMGQTDLVKDSAGRIIVAPIIYFDRSELLPREEVMSTLGLDPQKKTVFVQLGAGNINEIFTQIEVIVDVIGQFGGVQTVVAESVISATALNRIKGITLVKDYPLSRYYLGFDVAVSAAGYSTFTELMHLGVPSIFIPNLETASDDQLERALISERAGTGLVMRDFSAVQISKYLAMLLDDSTNAEFRARCLAKFSINGAETAARLLTNLFLGTKTEECLQ